MPLDFPLAASVFANRLRVREVVFQRQDYIEMSGTARGDVITSEIAAPKWTASVSLTRMSHADADEVQALIEAILPHGRFYLFNPARPYPIADPKGEILGSADVEIRSIGEDNRSMSLRGLPDEYVLTRGDLLAFNRGSGGSRRSLHRVVETVTANNAGVTPTFEVRPPFKSGTEVGQAVILKKPSALMMIAPGSFNAGAAVKLFTQGMSFNAIEAY